VSILDASGSVSRLHSGASSCELVTTTKEPPKPKVVSRGPWDLTLNWLLRQINAAGQAAFAIDRSSKTCRTPRRNDDSEQALKFFQLAFSWANDVVAYIRSVWSVQQSHGIDLGALTADQLFNPVLPLFENLPAAAAAALPAQPAPATVAAPAAGAGAGSGAAGAAAGAAEERKSLQPVPVSGALWPVSPSLPLGDIERFLDEHARALGEKQAELGRAFSAPGSVGKLLQADAAALCVALLQLKRVCQALSDAVQYVEELLRRQLVAAVGRELSALDFANYMRFHARKIFRAQYAPRAFSLAVRRPGMFPEGSVALDWQPSDGSLSEPVHTLCRQLPSFPLTLPLNASTRVIIGGERYAHALLQHQFSGDTGGSLSLSARARQFSGFLLLVGKLAAGAEFDCKGALIIQNKDDWKLPIMLEQLPAAKAFRDAIESLSPEQQRFAKAYRQMQVTHKQKQQHTTARNSTRSRSRGSNTNSHRKHRIGIAGSELASS
jgi:hypothetical protein